VCVGSLFCASITCACACVWVFCCRCCIFKSEREEKKSTKKRRFKTRDSQTENYETPEKTKRNANTPHANPQEAPLTESAKRGRYSLYPPVYKRARTRINTLHIHHAAAITTRIKKKIGEEREEFFRMQFNSLSNPLVSPSTGAGGGGEEICRDFLKVCSFCFTGEKETDRMCTLFLRERVSERTASIRTRTRRV